EEDEEHQFFFSSDLTGATTSYSDMDSNGNPVGLSSVLQTNDAETGTLTITLRHEPNKEGTGVSDGDITNAGGETDIEVTFNVDIQ
ncbi:MAG: type 1 periplasmic binding fold superfamily protein, partial [Flavobacteriales bacterium]